MGWSGCFRNRTSLSQSSICEAGSTAMKPETEIKTPTRAVIGVHIGKEVFHVAAFDVGRVEPSSTPRESTA